MSCARPSREWVRPLCSTPFSCHGVLTRAPFLLFRFAGKTAVFVSATLQQIEPVDGEVSVIVLCHTRELAYQIKNEYARFSKYMPDVRTGVFYGGTSVKVDQDLLKNKDKCPHIVVGTPGRLNALVRDKSLKCASVRHFVLDECDKMLEAVG